MVRSCIMENYKEKLTSRKKYQKQLSCFFSGPQMGGQGEAGNSMMNMFGNPQANEMGQEMQGMKREKLSRVHKNASEKTAKRKVIKKPLKQ